MACRAENEQATIKRVAQTISANQDENPVSIELLLWLADINDPALPAKQVNEVLGEWGIEGAASHHNALFDTRSAL
eukprot:SAG11_NODE_7882_length_1085_cov_1.309331_2_plen_76_part_00